MKRSRTALSFFLAGIAVVLAAAGMVDESGSASADSTRRVVRRIRAPRRHADYQLRAFAAPQGDGIDLCVCGRGRAVLASHIEDAKSDARRPAAATNDAAVREPANLAVDTVDEQESEVLDYEYQCLLDDERYYRPWAGPMSNDNVGGVCTRPRVAESRITAAVKWHEPVGHSITSAIRSAAKITRNAQAELHSAWRSLVERCAFSPSELAIATHEQHTDANMNADALATGEKHDVPADVQPHKARPEQVVIAPAISYPMAFRWQPMSSQVVSQYTMLVPRVGTCDAGWLLSGAVPSTTPEVELSEPSRPSFFRRGLNALAEGAEACSAELAATVVDAVQGLRAEGRLAGKLLGGWVAESAQRADRPGTR